MTKPDQTTGRFAYDGLDRMIHERARLSILTSLASNPKDIGFGDLRQFCGLTDRESEQASPDPGGGRARRDNQELRRNRPHTSCRLTAAGRQRFLRYLNVLEQVVHDAAAVRDRLGTGLLPA